MRSKSTLALALALASVLCSCLSGRYSLEDKPSSYIVIGSGGGFTNLVSKTFLFPNGQVFETQSYVDTTITHPNVKRRKARQLFRDLKSSNLRELEYNRSGNIYLFLTYVEDGEKYQFSWGVGGKNPPAELSEFYIRISELTHPEE